MIIEVDINVDCILQVPVLAANSLLFPTAMGVVWDDAAWEHVLLVL